MKRLVLIDGKSVFYRGYYAMGALGLADGTPTGGVYGFAAIAMEIVRKLNPTKVVVAWDSKSSTSKRKAIYADYKAGRVKPGEDFYAQIPLLVELIRDLGWTFIEVPDYEADDIIGTLSKEADEEGDFETFIISSDLDMLQIVDENTHMWRILKGFSNIQQMDVAEVEAKYQISKNQFLDLKALKGDASDNIPGVPGIGEKTAAKLLNEFGDVDGIYANLDKITGATRAKLAAGRDLAYMSLELARIMFDAPVKLAEVPDFVFDRERIVRGLLKLEFKSLVRKVNAEEMGGADLQSADGGMERVGDNAGSASEVIEDVVGEDDDSALVEVDGVVVGQDIKALMHDDGRVAKQVLSGRKFWDVMQAAFLLNPLEREFEGGVSLAEMYSGQRREFAKYPRLYEVYCNFDLPLIPVLYKMEEKGMLIDREYFSGLKNEYMEVVAKLEREICEMAGVNFNVNSPVQLSEILFGKLALPTKGIKKTARGYSTGARELEKLRGSHPIIEKIMFYRETAKLLSTYIMPMPDYADTEGRIHTTFTQNVTATGRLSSKDPNLQNIPVRTEEGKRIRAGFIAPRGRKLVSADYSQFELRLMAVLAGDDTLVADFNNDIDIHTKTAAEAFYRDEIAGGMTVTEAMSKVTKAERRMAKVINFGVLYGMSVKGLSEAAKMPLVEAKRFVERYFELRAPIKHKLEEFLRQAREKGYVETFYGRRRPTPDVKSTNFLIRQAAERAAANMPIQGTEADLMKRAMIKVADRLPAGADLIMQVHDSLIVECEDGQTDEVAEILRTEMESVAPELAIKLAVEVTVGQNWGEL